MRNRIVSSFSLVLLAATYSTGMAGSPAPRVASRPHPYAAARIEILVDGVARPQYAWSGTQYIEALKGRNYEIRITNPYPVRVAVALAVDGLNTIDARHTTAAAGRKWVLGPHETMTLGGWQVSLSQARRFQFTTEARSYGQFLGQTANLGVISAVFFRERVARPQPVLDDSSRASEAPAAGARSNGAGAEAEARSRKSADAPAAMPAGAAPHAPAAPDEYAATGIGERTAHAVEMVHVDLEEVPAASVSIRYEFRTQLVRLGILPADRADEDPLARRQQSVGFVPGFCPEPKR